MNCKLCKRQFQLGEMMYENSGQSPICYSCAEKGSLTAVMVFMLILFVAVLIVAGIKFGIKFLI